MLNPKEKRVVQILTEAAAISGKKLRRSFLIGIAIYLVFQFGAGVILSSPRDDTDGATRSGMRLHIDHKYGCEYLSTSNGGALIPRNAGEGKQAGCKK